MSWDRTGTNASSFIETPEGRIPQLGPQDRIQMVHDLYRAGWSYHLIAQAFNLADAVVREELYWPAPDRRRDDLTA